MANAIQNHARNNLLAGGNAVRVNRFLLRIDPNIPLRFLNYAVPDDDVDPTDAEIAELIAAFTSRDLLPRLEYLPVVAPALEARLREVGFTTESRMPLMACEPAELVAAPAPAGVSIVAPSEPAQFHAAVTVQYAAFGEVEPPTETDTRSMMVDPVSRGALALMAVDDRTGEVLAAGQRSVPVDGVAEVAGIATAEAHRGRGLGAALTAALTADAHRHGCHTVWLDPSGETAQRLYARVGYRVVGEKLHLIRE